MSEPILVVKDLSKKYGDFEAVKGISFSVSEGEILGLLGPNGAGKTQSISMMTGLFPPTTGRVQIGGLDISQQTSLIRKLRRSRDDAIANDDAAKAVAYESLIAQREQELQALLNLSAEYHSLQSTVSQASSTYNYLLDKEAEAKITENQIRNISFILVVEPAVPPRESTSSFSTAILALGAVLSLVLGLAIAFVWEYIEASGVQKDEPRKTSSSWEPLVHVG